MKKLAPVRLSVPDFAAVPRRHNRRDGWTAERQRAFIDALAETGSVKHAAERINMSSEGAYALRRAPGADGFRAAWEAALDHGVQSLADVALDRARDGVLVPVYSYGKLVGQRRIYNDRLLMFCLKHRIGRAGGEDAAPLPAPPGPRAKAETEQAMRIRLWDEMEPKVAGALNAEMRGLNTLANAHLRQVQLLHEARDREDVEAMAELTDCIRTLIAHISEGYGHWGLRAAFGAMAGDYHFASEAEVPLRLMRDLEERQDSP